MNARETRIPTDWIVPERNALTRKVRGVALADVQLVCGAGPYELDILIREQLSTPSLQVVGQVTLADRIFEPVSDLPLTLVKAETPEPVLDTRTDKFGEFDMLSERTAVYGLRVGDEKDAPCILLWEGEK